MFYYLFLAQTLYLFLFNYFLILAQIIISQKRPEIINRHLKCRWKLGLKMYLDGKTGRNFPRHGRYLPCHGNPSRLTVGFPVTREVCRDTGHSVSFPRKPLTRFLSRFLKISRVTPKCTVSWECVPSDGGASRVTVQFDRVTGYFFRVFIILGFRVLPQHIFPINTPSFLMNGARSNSLILFSLFYALA